MTRTTATMMLLCAAFFWGAGNVANKTVLAHVEPLTAVSLRCLIAAIVIAPFALRELRRFPGWAWVKSAMGLSVLFAAALAVQQIAFISTSVTNASFLVNTCVIITPLIAWLCLKERPGLTVIAAATVTVGGAFLMIGGDLSIAALNRGDLACFWSAIFYAGWTVALGHHVVTHQRPYATSLVQFGVSAALLIPLSFAFEAPTLRGIGNAWRELVVLGLFSTGAAFVLQTHAQQFVSSSTAAVLVSAESLFGAAGGYLLLGERTPVYGVCGAALILVGIIIAATGSKMLKPMTHTLQASDRDLSRDQTFDLGSFRASRWALQTRVVPTVQSNIAINQSKGR